MDFITGLSHTRGHHDSIRVIVDRMAKSSLFLVVNTTYLVEDYARLHGVPLSIISNRESQFTSYLWKSFQKGLGTHVNLSTTFYPQTDGQAEPTIQTFEDMLSSCVFGFKGVMIFGKKGKISHRYAYPYKILKRVGKRAYDLELPAELAAVHPVFHISLLKKCVGDPTSVVQLESVAVRDSLSYEDVPVEILDRQVRKLRSKEVATVKVLWRSLSVEGDTWEAEASIKSKYPHIFPSDSTTA
ncbi:uncharacterized protein [Solanum lycopersicum]|uniref:uncharacterized protein n=1 Tax=Solanum lycopersicum TaxID=4081 RepID=UPI003749EA59